MMFPPRRCRAKATSLPSPADPEQTPAHLKDLTDRARGYVEAASSANTRNCAQRGASLDRKDRATATVMAGICNTHASPPRQKEAVLPEDLIAMLETLDRGSLRGLRDRAMLLIGFAGGRRRSEIIELDLGRDQSEDGRGWIEILDKGLPVTLRGKTG